MYGQVHPGEEVADHGIQGSLGPSHEPSWSEDQPVSRRRWSKDQPDSTRRHAEAGIGLAWHVTRSFHERKLICVQFQVTSTLHMGDTFIWKRMLSMLDFGLQLPTVFLKLAFIPFRASASQQLAIIPITFCNRSLQSHGS